MLVDYAHPILGRVNKFLYSPAYLVLMGGLTILSNVFAQELYAYTIILLIGVYVCLFGRDLLPLLPIFICGYISPSIKNNPGLKDETIFSISGGGLYLGILLTALAVSLLYRLITDPVFGGKKFLAKKRRLLSGMLILCATYAISGLGSGQWAEFGWRNLLFAFLQLVAIAGLYYLFSGAVRWDLAPKAYLYWTGTCAGYVLLVELLNIYLTANVIVDGSILRNRLYTGWGHYNSMGALFAMIIPLTFFLTGKGKLAGFAYISAILFYLGLLFTCSRGSILIGTLIFVFSYILSLFHSRHARLQLFFHCSIFLTVTLLIYLFKDEIAQLFKAVGELGVSSPARLSIYKAGIKQFLRFPVFGGSFFPVDYDLYAWAVADSFTSLFPPRWHNTVVQLLATGGVVCLAGYAIHRIQTICLFVNSFSSKKLFAGFSILAMLLTSLVDCHFFNVGPVLLYSSILAVTEFQLENVK